MSGVHDAPLTDLVVAAQADASSDSVAMNEIVRRFEVKASVIARALTPDIHLQQDVANAALYAVVMAVRAHDPAVHGFAAYVVRTMRGAALRAFARLSHAGEISTAADAEVWATQKAPEVSSAVDGDLKILTADLSTEQRSLIFARYVEDVQIIDLARLAGTSKSALSHRFSTIHRTVRSTVGQRLVTA